jgi:UTP--glucose-1-phosphate uridylyltransferase
LQPEIFDILEGQERGAGNEIQLTDAMLKLGGRQPFYGYHYTGKTFDCGSPEGFIEANVAFSLWRPDMHENIAAMLEKMLADLKPIERRQTPR